jgi:hypothetical protein
MPTRLMSAGRIGLAIRSSGRTTAGHVCASGQGRLRRCVPLMSNVEVVDKPLFAAAREHSKRDDVHAFEFGRSEIPQAPRAGNAADKGFRLA